MPSNLLPRQVQSPSPRRDGQQQQLLLGWNDGAPDESIGFTPGVVSSDGDSQAVTYDGDAPL
jgi:hypothetical protein